nr:immunoglobulin heavy chain junction region [Mus musculus]MBK4189838.1 immunoglobulin heavy chain junction region [Mus musculus]
CARDGNYDFDYW